MPERLQMERRQRVLADFGEFAQCSDDPNDVLQEACRLVSDALDSSFANILEAEEDKAGTLVRAGVSWREKFVGRRLTFSDRSLEAYSLRMGEPVISRDIREEDRFDFAELLFEHREASPTVCFRSTAKLIALSTRMTSNS